jgi:hypothetical protein
MLILTAVLATLTLTLAGCASTSRPKVSSSTPPKSQGQDDREWLGKTLNDATVHSRGRPDDTTQPIYAPWW